MLWQSRDIAEFEAEFARAFGVRHAVLVGSTTEALRLALRLAHVEEGADVVVSAPFARPAGQAVRDVGAFVVPADVDADLGVATARTVRLALTPATRAVIVDDTGGVAADVDGIRAACLARGVQVIEHVGVAIGGTRHADAVGARADIAVWPLDIGPLNHGGGAVLSVQRELLAAEARDLRTPVRTMQGDLVGALARLWSLHESTRVRREAAERLCAGLAPVPGVRVVARSSLGAGSAWQLGVELLAGSRDRDELVARLSRLGVAVRAGWGEATARGASGWVPIATRLHDGVMTLELERADAATVVNAFRERAKGAA
ncbi:DegT/DnrJ/EryC1/StrS family aminotransferase [Gryllotalpicola ginsengisoli]|uniref:DegT/DnrJ/EryC1/StrS family aminotransferase n=1 Tax=Gryllotalpicola ginsengisoli TaxID=444608 RepID=UPI0003B590FA|nr:DegT/DnrJ/EryC1/StrS family aminotransferase [Gryllotalpicola ginsengisoli]